MTTPNLHDLANMTGAGNATKELKKSGHWDEYAGLEYVKWAAIVTGDVEVFARTEKEASEIAFDKLNEFRKSHIISITKVEELP